MANQENHIDPIQDLFSSKLREGKKAVPENLYSNVLSALPPAPSFSGKVINSLGKKGTVRLLLISLSFHLITFGIIGYMLYDNQNIQVNTPIKALAQPSKREINMGSGSSPIKDHPESLSAPTITEVKKSKKSALQKELIEASNTPKRHKEPVESGLKTQILVDTISIVPVNKSSDIIAPETKTEETIQEKPNTLEKDPEKFGIKSLIAPIDSAESIKLWKAKN